MKELRFKKLPIIEKDNEKEMEKLNIGDCFLYGSNIVNQRENKKVGMSITYYQVINKTKNGTEYTPIYDYMEEN